MWQRYSIPRYSNEFSLVVQQQPTRGCETIHELKSPPIIRSVLRNSLTLTRVANHQLTMKFTTTLNHLKKRKKGKIRLSQNLSRRSLDASTRQPVEVRWHVTSLNPESVATDDEKFMTTSNHKKNRKEGKIMPSQNLSCRSWDASARQPVDVRWHVPSLNTHSVVPHSLPPPPSTKCMPPSRRNLVRPTEVQMQSSY